MSYEQQKLDQGDVGERRGDECQCDVCGRFVPRLHAVWAYGLETYACSACTGSEDEEP